MYEELIMQGFNQSTLISPTKAVESTTALIVALATAIGTIGEIIDRRNICLLEVNQQSAQIGKCPYNL